MVRTHKHRYLCWASPVTHMHVCRCQVLARAVLFMVRACTFSIKRGTLEACRLPGTRIACALRVWQRNSG